MAIMLDLFHHAIESFKSEKPPGVNGPELINHVIKVEGKMMINDEGNTEGHKHATEVSEEFLTHSCLAQGNHLCCQQPDTGTKKEHCIIQFFMVA